MTIPVRVCGDHWVNPDQVRESLLDSDISMPVTLDFLAEGPSITALGIKTMLDEICQSTGRDPGSVLMINNPNIAEYSGYANVTPGPSHFFSMSKFYWSETCSVEPDARNFGLFVGRPTPVRAQMLRDCVTQFGDVTLLSRLRHIAPIDWTDQHPDLAHWWRHCGIVSLDGHSVKDQFDPEQNTNLDILQHYNRFQIEIVAETYCLGDTFFPTEKTVRPIMAAKPMLIYGPRKFLVRLRNLGFETWSDLWDESYDELEGLERWQTIKTVMHDLIEQDHWQDTARLIAQSNRLRLQEMLG